jgi:xylan 1,4-beta-xylosidase
VPFTGDPNSPYSGIGHNAVFTGPDGRDWLVCHYVEKGKPESLGYDPIWFEGKCAKSNGPSYVEVRIECPQR